MTSYSNQTVQKRPWMVTLFAVVVALSALPQGLGISTPILNSSLASAVQLIFVAILFLLITGFYGVTAWGLWKLKNWSRYTLIAIIIITFILQLTNKDMGSLFEQSAATGSLAILLGFILRAYVVYWFLDNGQFFNDEEDYLQTYKEVNVEVASVEDTDAADEQEADTNSQMMRSLIFGSLAGIVVIVVGIAIAIYMYLSPQTATSARNDPSAASIPTPIMPTKNPSNPRSFASIKLAFNTQGLGVEHPEEITVDGQGNMYINSQMDKFIYAIDPQGKSATMLDTTSDCADQQMLGTEGIYSDQYFYVMCGNTILQYNLDGFHINSRFDGEAFSPRIIYKDMTIYPDGTLLILADGNSAEIKEVVIHLNPRDGSILQRIDNPVSKVLNRSAMVNQLKPAVDSHGNIYILYGDDGTTYKFDAEGNYLLSFLNEHAETGIIGDIMHPQLSHPAHLIVIDAQDRILTVDSSNLALFDTDGNFHGQISTEFIGSVMDMYISNDDELYLLGSKTQDSMDSVSKVFKLKLYWH